MRQAPWPAVFLLGVAGGAIGTVGLAYLLAALKFDSWMNTRR